MRYVKKAYWYATLRQVRVGRTAFIYRVNETHGKRWPTIFTFSLRVSVGKREIIVATHDQHLVV